MTKYKHLKQVVRKAEGDKDYRWRLINLLHRIDVKQDVQKMSHLRGQGKNLN